MIDDVRGLNETRSAAEPRITLIEHTGFECLVRVESGAMVTNYIFDYPSSAPKRRLSMVRAQARDAEVDDEELMTIVKLLEVRQHITENALKKFRFALSERNNDQGNN